MRLRNITLRYLFALLGALLFFPGFATAAPGPIPHLPWLREGLVLNGTWFTMIYPGHAMDIVEDEHGNIHMADGARLTATPREGTSAGGVTAATVTCIDGNKVCLLSNSYADMRVLGCKDPVSQHMPLTFYFDATQCDLWIDPMLLAEMRSEPALHKLVTPIQWKAGEKIIDAIRVTKVLPNYYTDQIFDRKTGLCIHYFDVSRGGTPHLKYCVRGEVPEGDTQVAAGDFLAARDVPAPWADEPMPDWTKQFKALHYRGITRTVGPLANAPIPIAIDVDHPQVGNGWLGVLMTSGIVAPRLALLPTKSIFVTGRAQFDGFFAGPAGLAKLHAGQVLDEDPVTKMQTVASAVDERTVTITSANAGGQIFHTYDRQSGKLIAWGTFDNMSHTETRMQLQGEE